jgi:hypothetical protein
MSRRDAVINAGGSCVCHCVMTDHTAAEGGFRAPGSGCSLPPEKSGGANSRSCGRASDGIHVRVVRGRALRLLPRDLAEKY